MKRHQEAILADLMSRSLLEIIADAKVTAVMITSHAQCNSYLADESVRSVYLGRVRSKNRDIVIESMASHRSGGYPLVGIMRSTNTVLQYTST